MGFTPAFFIASRHPPQQHHGGPRGRVTPPSSSSWSSSIRVCASIPSARNRHQHHLLHRRITRQFQHEILPCARHLRVVFEHAQSTSCLAYVGLTSLGRDSCALGRNSSSTRLFTLSASFRCNLEAMDTDTSPSRARLLRSLQGSCTPGFQNMCPGHSTLASEKMAP